MNRYVYAFRLIQKGSEVFFRFAKLPEIISAVPKTEFERMDEGAIQDYALDAVITALQTRILSRIDVPSSDDLSLVKADGFVVLPVQQAMKLELFKLYKQNSRSISEFSRLLAKSETSARRLLDLRHQSWVAEIEAAIGACGKRLVHKWDIEAAAPTSRSQVASSSPSP